MDHAKLKKRRKITKNGVEKEAETERKNKWDEEKSSKTQTYDLKRGRGEGKKQSKVLEKQKIMRERRSLRRSQLKVIKIGHVAQIWLL